MICGKESHDCRLKKESHKIKKAPRAWYSRIDGYLVSLGFTKSVIDLNLYYKVIDNDPLIFVLYANDLFLTKA